MKKQNKPESLVRAVLDACADCDICRFLMEDNCLLFPELYRLYDQETETGRSVKVEALRKLAQLCTFCGLCPCPNIRNDIVRSKIEQVHAEGMALKNRLLADVQQIGRWTGMGPQVMNTLLSFSPVRRVIKKVAGIHPKRDLPSLAEENFFVWAREKGLGRQDHQSPKVAYFAGCTAGYFFPHVAKAAVHVLQHCGIGVHVPPQQCCGMPTLFEGDEEKTLARMRSNIKPLLQALQNGYDLVCSCPTCGFLMKTLLKEGAYYSKAYQDSVKARENEIVVPGQTAGNPGFIHLKKNMYQKILVDDGFFSSIDPLDRIALSENVMDLGEYLGRLWHDIDLDRHFGQLQGRMVYFASCHQREQQIGSPYLDLLAKLPGLMIEQVGGTMDCCGMGGSLGIKRTFYDASIRLANPLIQKIKAAQPNMVITDCLSCRLQFQHLLPYPVYHPVEILRRTCKA